MSQFINYSLTVRNQGEIVPQVEGHESKHGHFDRKQRKHIEFCLKKLRDNKLDSREDFSYFGNSLFEALLRPVEVSFSGEVWKQLTQLETTHLRIRIVFEEVDEPTELASQIINLPWEFLCYPDDNNTFLGTHPRVALSYGYQTWLNNPLEGYAVRESPLRVLFVHGHPSKLDPVGFVSLVQKILTELGKSVEVKELKNPTPKELSEVLKEKPHVLHFLGHGKPGALALGDLPDGETSWLEDQSLSDFLRAGGVKLVVLQACKGASPSEELAFTGTAAQLVKTHIPAVIAIRYPISQSLAWNFVRTLYDKLAAEEPVDVAVQAGREQLAIGYQSHASRDFGAPVLWMRLRDGLLFATDERTPEGEEEKEAEPFTDEKGEVICPYQGLNAFTEETKQFFFGRVRNVEEIEQRLKSRGFVPVIGASGSGKSSVVLAGLIPRLKDLGGWEILPSIRPGDEPIAELKNVFKPYFSSKKELQQLNDFLKKEPPNLQGLIDRLIERLPESERESKSFLLVVDQFEELFTLCSDEAEVKQFIKLLAQVEEIKKSRLSIVITLRADFVVDCLKDSDLTQLIKDPVFMLSLEGANLEAAIVKPAQSQGYALEEGLLGEILEDVAKEKGILPLLEFALTQLWEKRDEKKHQLTLDGYKDIGGDGYKDIGGVIGALNKHAEKVYNYRDYEKDKPEKERSELEKALIKRIFLKLLRTGDEEKDPRQRQLKADILCLAGENSKEQEILGSIPFWLICFFRWTVESGSHSLMRYAFSKMGCSQILRELIDGEQGLVKGRLLVAGGSEQEGKAWIDLAHEALIGGWTQLNNWRIETREGRKLAIQADNDAQTWKKNDKFPDYLWRGYKLAEAEKVLQEYAATVPLSEQAQEFLQTSSLQELRTYLQSTDIDNIDQKTLKEEAANKSFLTKERLRHLLEDEREDARVRLATSWLLEQWGEEMPRRMAEVDGEGKILLRVIEEKLRVIEEKLPPTKDFEKEISLELVEIPGGEFQMGSPQEEAGEEEEKSYPEELPQHQVRVSPFLIGRYPVTQAQWQAVARLSKVELNLKPEPSQYKGDSSSLPVERVTWFEAVEFCKRLSCFSQEKGKGYQYRLPSEAEWEYACRAKTETPYHFGQKISPALANYQDTARGRTTPVRRFQLENVFGLYDMHGNVFEWCADYGHTSYEGAPDDGSAWLSDNNDYRMVRGGSWTYLARDCRSAYRRRRSPYIRSNELGFRVVCGLPRT